MLNRLTGENDPFLAVERCQMFGINIYKYNVTYKLSH